MEEWFKHDSKGRVNPARFFVELRKQLDDDAIVVADDGNHTFLSAELMPIHAARGFISPTDFNCMGYATPAVTAVKLVNPDKQVVGIHKALAYAAQNKPVIVDVKIDYSKRTRFTKGIVKTNLERFTIGNKARFVGRALLRKVTG